MDDSAGRNLANHVFDLVSKIGLVVRQVGDTTTLFTEGELRQQFQFDITYVESKGMLLVEGFIPVQLRASVILKFFTLLNHVNDNPADLGYGRFSYRVDKSSVVFSDCVMLYDEEDDDDEDIENNIHLFNPDHLTDILACAVHQLDCYYPVFMMSMSEKVSLATAYAELKVCARGSS